MEMKETSSRLTRTLGQEINDKQVGLSDELKKIGSLTMVERLRATTLISRDNAALNVFYSLCDKEREAWVKVVEWRKRFQEIIEGGADS
ncbi:hypothetical protein WN944_001355 [Citrus x changshan-huyou]|uniref:Uncharacterized protein n=1 Tax=Citrus x changshan-huyou TaxID=2935761 RepID=A0AAP0MEI4_9ROSI